MSFDSKGADCPTPLWGAKAIGEAIGKNSRQTFWLLQNGRLPARKVGALWVSERSTLLTFLKGKDPMAA